MKKPYCCDDSRNLYERYYDRQQKEEGEFPVLRGPVHAKGTRSRENSRVAVQTHFTRVEIFRAARAACRGKRAARRVPWQVVERVGYKRDPKKSSQFRIRRTIRVR
jgi:hypothetical protein